MNILEALHKLNKYLLLQHWDNKTEGKYINDAKSPSPLV